MRLGMIAKLFRKWWFTFAQILIYLATFAWWKEMPVRWVFVVGGVLASGLMTIIMLRARKQSYFLTRTDFLIHLLIVLDLVVEGFIYEIYALMMWIWGFEADEVAVVHNHNGFYLCAAAFFAIAFGYRLRVLLRKPVGGEK